MSTIHLDIQGPVAELRLDNPSKLNALTQNMMDALQSHCAYLEREEEVRVVLLRAQGDRAFCVGADINEWSKLSPRQFARDWVRDGHRIFDRLARLSKPTIGVLQGHAFGGGLELAAACDLRIAAPDVKLALPEAGVGIVPGWSGTHRLRRLLPEPVIKEMALFGRQLSAKRGFELGFIAQIEDDPIACAREIARTMTDKSARSVEAIKYMIHAGAGEDTAAMIETLGGGMIAASDDNTEGVRAFLEKRKPKFTGL